MITILHANEFGEPKSGYTLVATVDVDNLNDAFRLTQNIHGSWSMPQRFDDGEINKDYDPRISTLVDLRDEDGEIWGLRSTSSGDIVGDGTDYYILARKGWTKVTKFSEVEKWKTL